MKLPILILHGWGSSSKSFEEISRFLREKGHQVFTPDLPGFGNERTPDKPWPIDDYVNFVFNFVQAQDVNKFILLGHSFGGRIGIKFAARYPEKLSGLILYAAAGIKPRRTVWHDFLFVLAKIGGFVFSLPLLSNISGVARKALYFLSGSHDYYHTKGVMRETMQNVISEDLRDILPSIAVPTLILWGSKDTITPVRDAAVMKSAIHNAEYVVLEGKGHSAHKEDAQQFAEAVLSFIGKLGI